MIFRFLKKHLLETAKIGFTFGKNTVDINLSQPHGSNMRLTEFERFHLVSCFERRAAVRCQVPVGLSCF